MPYSPYIGIIPVRLHLCANIKAIRQLIMDTLHLKLCDFNLTYKGHTSSKILR